MADDSVVLPDLLLVVGEGDERLAKQCERVAKKLGASVERIAPRAVAQRAAAVRPAAIVLSNRRLADDAGAYPRMAEHCGAALVSVDDDARERGELELLLDTTLAGAAVKREAALPPVIGPSPDKPD